MSNQPTWDMVHQLRRERDEARLELQALELQVSGEDLPRATRWLQQKVRRQRWELNRIVGGNTRLRWQLRQIEKLGRGLTRDEYLAAREAEQDRQVADRIGEPAA